MLQPMRARPTLPAALFALLLIGTACSSAAQPPSAQQAMARLEAAIGDARCTSDSQCRSVAVGHRACGGPELYLAWSTQRSSAQAIDRAVADFNAASRPALPGRTMSTCVFLHDPGAYCLRVAVAAPAGTATSAARSASAASAAATADGPGRCQLGSRAPPAGGASALPVR